MRGMLFRLVFVYLFLPFAAYSQHVNEAASEVVLDGQSAIIRLSVNSERSRQNVPVSLELIDTNAAVTSTESRTIPSLGGGRQIVEFRLPIDKALERPNDDLAWYRLRYRVGESAGIVSLSQLLRDLFELRVIASDLIMSGMVYRARIRALNPFTQKPAVGVRLETTLALELESDSDKDDELKLKAAGETDADGYSIIDFEIPAEAKLDGDGKITVTGRLGGLVREASEDIDTMSSDVQVLSMTDKPLYQPGQMLNVRGIVMKGGEAKTVLGGVEVEFRIEDEDGTLIYREKTTASSFGVASVSWRIPSNVKLGSYRIQIRDADGEQIGGEQIKVSRYDLPNFVVNAKPSKPYYLPADKNAEVEIRAAYLFGKPVTKGKVRVVEETSRNWNWKKQKYDIDEGEVREGETDAEGKFVANFDISKVHEDLKDDDGSHFEDQHYAAYFTDATTNKTEQRRFDVRITREPIHVYLIKGADFTNGRLPLIGYISTFYADGTPAECSVEIKARC
jgi:hypothetical protein